MANSNFKQALLFRIPFLPPPPRLLLFCNLHSLRRCQVQSIIMELHRGQSAHYCFPSKYVAKRQASNHMHVATYLPNLTPTIGLHDRHGRLRPSPHEGIGNERRKHARLLDDMGRITRTHQIPIISKCLARVEVVVDREHVDERHHTRYALPLIFGIISHFKRFSNGTGLLAYICVSFLNTSKCSIDLVSSHSCCLPGANSAWLRWMAPVSGSWS
ncbi:hypothetical protein F5B18DRAFT_508537 [Nemania serpens]|nr:hypothetical protein F5B18DRAFT_508537 [Nemania serpens]